MTIKNNQLEDSPRITTKVGSNPPVGANQGAFFPKEVTGVVEGFYVDSQGRTIQITDNGNLKVPPSLVGEVNTASNAGSIGEGLALPKVVYDLPFKRLKAGQNITLNPQSTYIEIIANFPPSQGEANTASNVGLSGVGIFKQKTGVNLEFKRLKAGANVTLTATLNDEIQIDAIGGGGGGGDMYKSTYDVDNNGIVDNSSALNGQASSYYLARGNHTGTQSVSTITGLATIATTGNYSDLVTKPALNNLTDVNAGSPTNGQVLTWNTSTSKWIASSAAGTGDMQKATYDVNNNGIVDNSEALNNQAGSYYLSRSNHTGTQLVSTITGLASVATSGLLSSLTDTLVSSPTLNQVLQWNGTKWINATLSAGSGDMLKSSYDTINSGNAVDNSRALNSQAASFYLSRANHTGTQSASTITGLATIATTGNYSDLVTKPALNNLTDVNAGSPTNGQVLTWNSGTSKWIASTAAGSGDMLKSTYDIDNNGIVDNSSALNSQAGSYYLSRSNHTGTQSVSTITGLASVATAGTLDSLSDVTAPSPATNDVLKWNGSAWVNGAGGGGSSDVIQRLSFYTNTIHLMAYGPSADLAAITVTKSANAVTIASVASTVQLQSIIVHFSSGDIGAATTAVVNYPEPSANTSPGTSILPLTIRMNAGFTQQASTTCTYTNTSGTVTMTYSGVTANQATSIKMVW